MDNKIQGSSYYGTLKIDESELTNTSWPCVEKLKQLCFNETLQYGLRTAGMTISFTAISREICNLMMNMSDPKINTTLLAGIGTILYLAGNTLIFQESSVIERFNIIKQGWREAVVPAVVTVGVYLTAAHQIV